MSGRVKWRRDGKTVTGYRKTDRRQAEAVPRHELPDYVVRFMLPTSIGFAIAEGPTGIIGVSVTTPGPIIEARGKDLRWVLGQAAAYIGTVAGGNEHQIPAMITRDAYPGATTDGPLHKAVRHSCELIYVPGASVVVPRAVDRAIIFPVE